MSRPQFAIRVRKTKDRGSYVQHPMPLVVGLEVHASGVDALFTLYPFRAPMLVFCTPRVPGFTGIAVRLDEELEKQMSLKADDYDAAEIVVEMVSP